jgi:DNA-binding protein H-NS
VLSRKNLQFRRKNCCTICLKGNNHGHDNPKTEGVKGMALQTTINNLKDLLSKITQDLHKAEGGNKAASQRVRTMTVRLEKIAKGFRKESINSEKQNKGMRKAPKKAGISKTKIKTAPKMAKPAMKPKGKAKPKAALAKPRPLSFKKSTAKLPIRRPNFR